MITFNNVKSRSFKHQGEFPSLYKRTPITIAILLLGYIWFGILPPTAAGDTVSNENYSIDVGNIDTNPQPSPRPQVLGKQVKSEFTTGPNYTVSTSDDSFSVSISQDTIDYGILSSTNPVIRTSDISITRPKYGAEILTSEDHPLQFNPKFVIQNTTCDNGVCTPITAALWTNTLTYGFGYRCDDLKANVCDPQFFNTNYFKQYPNISSSQDYEPILLSDQNNALTKATITNKVNISGTQKPGGYYNSITYLAIPNF